MAEQCRPNLLLIYKIAGVKADPPWRILPPPAFAFKHLCGQLKASRFEFLRELRPDSGRNKIADDATLGRNSAALEQENILQRDDVTFHARNLSDMRKPPRPVAQSANLHYQLDRRCDLAACRLRGPRGAARGGSADAADG